MTPEAKNTYEVAAIEKKWQAEWAKRQCFAAKESDPRPRFYALEMFPYPSGNLHMGHVRNYSIGDVVARYHRMKGENVLHPIGWDAFGLPAENAAIKHKVHPEKWTRENIAVMREQLKSLGISYDWDREFATCDTEYYRWNQWFFIQFFNKGWVYKKKALVNWCPVDQTVLANEQVSADGRCWRCDSLVEQKELEQWFIKITDFAEDLLKGHDLLKGKWPDEVITMQQHWIGKSDGAEVIFPLEGRADKITVFTTRPDTLYGATFLALAPEHPLARELSAKWGRTSELETLIKTQRERKRQREDTGEKTGFFIGVNATNPITQKPVPIWVADYVLMDYGTGAIMAVPAHDQRDYEFATKYKLPVIEVIGDPKHPTTHFDKAMEAEGVMVNSGEFNGTPSPDGKRKVGEWLKTRGSGKPTVTYKLRDWLISRQRYWGTPIPMINCPTCGIVPVSEKDLPVKLPTDVAFTGTGQSPLAQSASFVNVLCPKCRDNAKRETDTMDTFVDSSWYFARYCDARNSIKAFDPTKAGAWLPVNQYIGGIEHACMHLIYSRFWHKAMKKLGLVQCEEPFERLLAQGMVTLGGSAMSKSRGNVVDPGEIIEKFGADTARLFILFKAPPEKQLDWDDAGVEGSWRFLNRVWRLVENYRNSSSPAATGRGSMDSPPGQLAAGKQYGLPLRTEGVGATKTAGNDVEKSLRRKTHWAIDKVTRDYGIEIQINTAVSAVMELVNELYLYPAMGDAASGEAVKAVMQLLSPVTPHLMEELWESLGEKGICSQSPWPTADPQWLIADTVEIVIQINGKLRSRLQMAPGTGKDVLEKEALKDAKVMAALSGKSVGKVIIVPDKLVNIVAK